MERGTGGCGGGVAEKTDKQRKKAGSGRIGQKEAEKERRGEGS